ncbi:putative RNA pyrophosphohydrolase [Modestobacter italicus]|uniref:RNA pyrophosphohydrolase n=2 Tax=Modestobacter italicus (strain DSM 44449 / CECT 9708 / BC 501) TaxID=2732864 RepID=I4EXX1_MODI5|nr:putative RNA pyrophosphohydrolase [Modestobacter marinus]
MTTIERVDRPRPVPTPQPPTGVATTVAPAVFVAVRGWGGRLLLVQRCDSGVWEMPGRRVSIGETAVEAAVRGTAERAGMPVLVTGVVGLFTDPRVLLRDADGVVCQQFAVLFRARSLGGVPRGDGRVTSRAAWVPLADLPGLVVEPYERRWIVEALAQEEAPHLG